jgi:SAM-dependent methyltransferase
MRDYRRNHTGSASRAAGYDQRLFSPGKYDHMIWQQEKSLLDEVVETMVPRRGRYLDFACGTGRILGYLEERFDESVGLDLSSTMLDQARPKLSRAQLVCGDATRDPDVVEGRFDFITAFRFFLNAQPELRDEAMDWLVSRLRDRDSLLFFNNHGNTFSSRQILSLVKRLQGKKPRWMSRGEVHRLAKRHGLEVVAEWGRGYADKDYFKELSPAWFGRLDRTLRFILPEMCAVHLFFACRRK